MTHPLDAQVFLKVIRPGLEQADPARLARDVSKIWQPCQIGQFLQDNDIAVRRSATLVLGLVGTSQQISALALALHDQDEQVNQLAEDSMWSIWFRSCNDQAAGPFDQGVTLLGQERYREALGYLDQARHLDPSFIEVCNQRAIAYFFLSEWELSLACCKKVIARVPVHFGAISGQGHCYLQLGKLQDAMDSYKQALLINPRMSIIRDAVSRLEKQQ